MYLLKGKLKDIRFSYTFGVDSARGIADELVQATLLAAADAENAANGIEKLLAQHKQSPQGTKEVTNTQNASRIISCACCRFSRDNVCLFAFVGIFHSVTLLRYPIELFSLIFHRSFVFLVSCLKHPHTH